MSQPARIALLYAVMALLIVAVGVFQTWTVALAITNLCLISAIMALGVNIQWGYAGLFNVGIMGFAALGGVAAVLTSMRPVPGALSAGGWNLGLTALVVIAYFFIVFHWSKKEYRDVIEERFSNEDK